MPMRLIANRLTKFDIYGHPITVNLAGSGVYKTKLGALATLLTYILVVINLMQLVTQFIDKSNQKESTQNFVVDDIEEQVSFIDNKYQVMLKFDWDEFPES